MKTAVQELIEELEVLENNTISMSDKFLIKSIRFKTIAKLEKEKEQLIKDYHSGQMSIVDLFKDKLKEIEVYNNMTTDKEDAEEYYNQTYNKNK